MAATCGYVTMGPSGGPEEAIPTLFLTQERASTASSESSSESSGAHDGRLANRFVVRDRSGATVGGAYESCAKGLVGGRALTAYCSGIIEISGKGKIGFQASRSVADGPDERHTVVTGIVTGGTGAYADAGGEMDLTPPVSDADPWVAEFR
ncbi:hypothetical protein AB0C93_15365 [Streptomyces sp. NPDC048518]|uniref:hypothetical protein n=1 Tax=Streptomyces sp. NPDC048518 TaxID=3155029 RepID=UPI0033EAE2A5